MRVKPPLAFSTSPGDVRDFAGRRPAEIFNEIVVPRVSSVLQLAASAPPPRVAKEYSVTDDLSPKEKDSFEPLLQQ